MVFHDRSVYQEEHATQLIMARRVDLHTKAEYICADLSSRLTPRLQARGGSYILVTKLPVRQKTMLRFAIPLLEMIKNSKLRNRQMNRSDEAQELPKKRSWIIAFSSLIFIVLQSACTAVMAISGVRVLIGIGALAAAAGLGRPATGFHMDAIRIPMMILAVAGSIINLYSIWRIRTLRSRASSQWRAQIVTLRQRRSENLQIALAIFTLGLVIAEYATHLIVHNV
jgi:hypothetical protein